GVPDWRDAADGDARVVTDEIGIGAPHLRDVDQPGQFRGIDPMAAAGQDEQRLAVRVEDEAVGDLTDLDAQGRRSLRGSAGRVIENAHRRVDARSAESVLYANGVGVQLAHVPAWPAPAS